MKLAPQRLVFLEQPPITEQPLDLGKQVFKQHRFHQVVVCTALKGRNRVFDRGVGRDHDEQHFRAQLPGCDSKP